MLKPEQRRVPRPANPFLHFLVLLVLWISQRRQQVVVAVGAAAILRWADVGSSQTDRMFEVGVGRQALFDLNIVLPATTQCW